MQITSIISETRKIIQFDGNLKFDDSRFISLI